MALYDNLTWWMNRPAGMTDAQAAQTYGVLSPLAGQAAQTASIGWGANQGIGTGPGNQLVLKDPADIARAASVVGSLPRMNNPWAGRVMGDTIGGAQSNWLNRRGQDLSYLNALRDDMERQREFNISQQNAQQARADKLGELVWNRNVLNQSRQQEIDQRDADSFRDYLSSLARTDTQSRMQAQALGQKNDAALAAQGLRQQAGASALASNANLSQLLSAGAEIQSALTDAQERLDLRQKANPVGFGQNFLADGAAGPVTADQDLMDQISQLRRAMLLNQADVQSAKAMPRGTVGATGGALGVTSLPAASQFPPTYNDAGGISPALLTQLLAAGNRFGNRTAAPVLSPLQKLAIERGNVIGNPTLAAANYGTGGPAYGTNSFEQDRYDAVRNRGFVPSPAGGVGAGPTYSGGPSGGLPAVPPWVEPAMTLREPTRTLRLTSDGNLVPAGGGDVTGGGSNFPDYTQVVTGGGSNFPDYTQVVTGGGSNFPDYTQDSIPELQQVGTLLQSLSRSGLSAEQPLLAPLSRDIARALSVDPAQIGGSTVYQTPEGQVYSALRSGQGPVAQQIRQLPPAVLQEMLRSAVREYYRNPTGRVARLKTNI